MKRVFLGVFIPTSLQEKIEQYVAQQNLDVRWIWPENLHLTLYFIGDLTDESVAELAINLEEVQRLSKFELAFDKITFAPLKNYKSMIWALYKLNEEFDEMVGAIFGTLISSLPEHSARFKKPRHPNFPHISLARFKYPSVSKQELPSVELPDFVIDRFQLIESELTPTGSIYKVLNEYQLQN